MPSNRRGTRGARRNSNRVLPPTPLIASILNVRQDQRHIINAIAVEFLQGRIATLQLGQQQYRTTSNRQLLPPQDTSGRHQPRRYPPANPRPHQATTIRAMNDKTRGRNRNRRGNRSTISARIARQSNCHTQRRLVEMDPSMREWQRQEQRTTRSLSKGSLQDDITQGQEEQALRDLALSSRTSHFIPDNTASRSHTITSSPVERKSRAQIERNRDKFPTNRTKS